jgi:phage-related protein
MAWSYYYYDDAVQAEIENLLPAHLARLAHIRELVDIDGPNLGHPHTDSFGDGLFEMRLKGPETIARIFFCYFKGKRIVFLHSFVKKSQKTPAKAIALARQRMTELRQKEKAEEEAKNRNEKRQ